MAPLFVHPTAVIDAGVEIGEGARIWHFCHVSEGARIGERCSLGQNVFVGRGVSLGDGVKVQNNVSIYEGVQIADDVFLGPSCVFTNVAAPRAFIERKDGFRPTRVGRGATIGANATIICGNSIGPYAFVGAGAVVTHDVPAYALVFGNPARRMGWACRCGVTLPEAAAGGLDDAPAPRTGRTAQTTLRCQECGDAYVVEGEACRPAPVSDGPNEPIPLIDLRAQHAPLMPGLIRALERVVGSGEFILGEEVHAFEQEAAATLGVAFAVGVSSGTDALLVALLAAGVGPGDEVVTTAYSFFATAGSIARTGAKVVLADIELATMNLDVKKVASAVNERTKAIVCVHLFGRPCDMRALRDLASQRGLYLIEDAAQAFGARTPDGPVGSLGDAAAFSFFPTKSLGALGDGGLVTTNNEQLAERVRLLRAHGASSRHNHLEIGGNFRLDALQAAFLREKLPHVERWNLARRLNAERYSTIFASAGLRSSLLHFPREIPAGHVFHQLTIRTSRRDALKAHLAEQGIATEVYYPRPLHLQPALAGLGYASGSFPSAERASREALSLPIFPELGESRVTRIAKIIVAFLRG